MPRDILIVDDVKSALGNFGNHVKLNLSIEPFLADDTSQAIQILENYQIKVLIVDQKLPKMTGIQLAEYVKNNLRLSIPCIMLTGYPEGVKVSEAVDVGLFRFIDKTNVATELIPAIKEALIKYEQDNLTKNILEKDEIISVKKSIIQFGNSVELKLVRIPSVRNTVVREQDWSTQYVAQRGIKNVQEIDFKRKVTLSYNSELKTELLNKTGGKLTNLIGVIETSLENKLTFLSNVKYEQVLELEAKYRLEVNEITDQHNSKGILLQSREYQVAPVFARINCVLQVDCSCCGIPKDFDVILDLPSNKIALRQVEHFDDGSTNIIYTGYYTGSLNPVL